MHSGLRNFPLKISMPTKLGGMEMRQFCVRFSWSACECLKFPLGVFQKPQCRVKASMCNRNENKKTTSSTGKWFYLPRSRWQWNIHTKTTQYTEYIVQIVGRRNSLFLIDRILFYFRNWKYSLESNVNSVYVLQHSVCGFPLSHTHTHNPHNSIK
jgi:hypothetical protein